MRNPTFQTYAQAVRDYLECEWPAAWRAAARREVAQRELVRVLLREFIRGSSIPVAAGEAAFALALLA